MDVTPETIYQSLNKTMNDEESGDENSSRAASIFLLG